MKKFLLTALLVIAGTTTAMAIIKPTDLDLVLKNLSEVRYNLFQGDNEKLNATFMTGEREETYILNGVATELIDFGIITLNFKEPQTARFGVPTYKLTIGDNYYEGEFEKSPFNVNYVADIGIKMPDDSQVYLLVEWDDLYETLKLDPISPNWEINWEKALEIGMENIAGTNFEELISEGKLNAEVHLIIIGDPQGITDKYYWYISIYGQAGSTIELVIDPMTGELISKRVVQF
ncbi:MAG: hypothetical protein PHC46_03820 [Clostridia bacterium]|nr:hypothetical protein [Clostridia bacterium]